MYNKRAYYNNCQSKGNRFRGHGEHPLKKAWKENMKAKFNNPPANVRELDNSYELHLFAPGFEKNDFKIGLTDDVLSISVEQKETTNHNWKRQEYTPRGFVRQFELNDKINKEAIGGKYENGVLILNLPKLEGFETARQEIEID